MYESLQQQQEWCEQHRLKHHLPLQEQKQQLRPLLQIAPDKRTERQANIQTDI